MTRRCDDDDRFFRMHSHEHGISTRGTAAVRRSLYQWLYQAQEAQERPRTA
jgi:hypothetical protein